MADNSFDVVSKIEMPEVSNAIQQALKEIQQRYDLKDSKSSIELKEKDNKILLASSDDFKLKAVTEVLQAAGSSVTQEITLQSGIPLEKAKEIVKVVKDSKKKVQASIQGDVVRIAGKDRDDLQAIIQLLKGTDLGIDMQFTNYRS